jgi:hypothetical protein
MKVGDYVNTHKEVLCKAMKAGLISPTVIERADIYNKVKDEYCKTSDMRLSVSNVSIDLKINEAKVLRSARNVPKNAPNDC